MKLSKNFTLEEMLITNTGLPNVPNEVAERNLTYLCQRLLQPLRTELGVPLVITSGFRSDAVNKAIKGSPTSDHRYGRAADFLVSGKPTSGATALKVLRTLEQLTERDRLTYDQCIIYHPSKGGHIHLSYRHNAHNRKEVLYMDENGDYLDFAELIAKTLG